MNISSFFKLALLFVVTTSFANANDEKVMRSAAAMVDFIVEIGSDVTVNGHEIDFEYDDVPMGIVYDAMSDRMQVAAPVTRVSNLKEGQLMEMLEANFHTMLDVRYAVDEGKVYAMFLHPISELHENHLRDVLKQVASAKNTFGKRYSAGSIVYSGHIDVDLKEPLYEEAEDEMEEYSEEVEVDNFVEPDEDADDIKDRK